VQTHGWPKTDESTDDETSIKAPKRCGSTGGQKPATSQLTMAHQNCPVP